MRAPFPPPPANFPSGALALGTSFLSTILCLFVIYTVFLGHAYGAPREVVTDGPSAKSPPVVRVTAVKDAEGAILLRSRRRTYTLREFAEMHACGGVPMGLVVELAPAIRAEEAGEILRMLGPAFIEFRFVPQPPVPEVKP